MTPVNPAVFGVAASLGPAAKIENLGTAAAGYEDLNVLRGPHRTKLAESG